MKMDAQLRAGIAVHNLMVIKSNNRLFGISFIIGLILNLEMYSKAKRQSSYQFFTITVRCEFGAL